MTPKELQKRIATRREDEQGEDEGKKKLFLEANVGCPMKSDQATLFAFVFWQNYFMKNKKHFQQNFSSRYEGQNICTILGTC